MTRFRRLIRRETSLNDLPPAVLLRIASYLPGIKDQSNFSLVCQACRPAGQRFLFQTLVLFTNNDDLTFAHVVDFLSTHPVIATYITRLALYGIGGVGWDTCFDITIQDVQHIIEKLPALEQLLLHSFFWVVEPSSPPITYRHPALLDLEVECIYAVDNSQSILDVLAFSTQWRRVHIIDVEHPSHTPLRQNGPFPASSVIVSHCQYNDEASEVLPTNRPAFKNVRDLIIVHAVDTYHRMLHDMLTQSIHSVQRLTLHFGPKNILFTPPRWVDALSGLRGCSQLRSIHLSIPLEPNWIVTAVPPPPKLSDHIQLLPLLTLALPPSLILCEIEFQLNHQRLAPSVTQLIKRIPWRNISANVTRLSGLRALILRLDCTGHRFHIMPEDVYRFIVLEFNSFPKRLGTFCSSPLYLYKEEHELYTLQQLIARGYIQEKITRAVYAAHSFADLRT
ncbi:hypothetical protein NM688_g4756 [Phlebia brevispora]|uniref:Uncharacterized protein n=1 Tax=Phlebia brevispora TaxID=194682 RepID=A0ACC1T1Q6_9APHY|nr:hypothetical protein NM688_g4756 [Phlebia brevispora]